MNLGTLNVLGAARTAANTRDAGMMFGSGAGYTDFGLSTAATGSITLTNNSILANNPNFTVSSLPGATTNNDTTFAMWDGGRVIGSFPTQATIAASGAADFPMVVAPEAVLADQTINNLVTDATVTITGACSR